MNLWNHLVFWLAFELKTFLNRQWSTLHKKKQKKTTIKLTWISRNIILWAAFLCLICSQMYKNSKKVEHLKLQSLTCFWNEKTSQQTTANLKWKIKLTWISKNIIWWAFFSAWSVVKSAKIKNKKMNIWNY